ncbi:MAG: DUF2892 domain-containing protein [Pelistega sp.]|nr:DUF2892 domain-containing protein [Pelistega sp.]
MFTTNLGSIDRLIRIFVGALLIGLTLAGTIGAWGWIGVIPLVTGLIGSCPLYKIFGLSSCPLKKQ